MKNNGDHVKLMNDMLNVLHDSDILNKLSLGRGSIRLLMKKTINVLATYNKSKDDFMDQYTDDIFYTAIGFFLIGEREIPNDITHHETCIGSFVKGIVDFAACDILDDAPFIKDKKSKESLGSVRQEILRFGSNLKSSSFASNK